MSHSRCEAAFNKDFQEKIKESHTNHTREMEEGVCKPGWGDFLNIYMNSTKFKFQNMHYKNKDGRTKSSTFCDFANLRTSELFVLLI